MFFRYSILYILGSFYGHTFFIWNSCIFSYCILQNFGEKAMIEAGLRGFFCFYRRIPVNVQNEIHFIIKKGKSQ